MNLLSPSSPASKELSRYSRIGLFDSGVGGLSVLKQLASGGDGADRSFVYLGDTARCPYGNRDAGEIELFVEQIVSWLCQNNIEALVMACNTSAALAYETAERVSSVPVYDLIRSTAHYAASLKKRIGIMATASTAKSRAFSRAIHAVESCAEVIEYGCPDLVPLVESGLSDSELAAQLLSTYVSQLMQDGVEALILGCTHFPFFKKRLIDLIGESIVLIDPAELLTTAPQLNGNSLIQSCDFFVTGDIQGFCESASLCLGYMPESVQHISVADLVVCGSPDRFAIGKEPMASHAVPGVVQ